MYPPKASQVRKLLYRVRVAICKIDSTRTHTIHPVTLLPRLYKGGQGPPSKITNERDQSQYNLYTEHRVLCDLAARICLDCVPCVTIDFLILDGTHRTKDHLGYRLSGLLV